MKTKPQHNKVNVVTLGCSKNLVDSENMMVQLRANDFEVSHENYEDPANIIIINTCGFIDNAKEESINTILTYSNIKAQGDIDKLYVTGCLSERYKADLQKEMPQVDAFFGTLELPELLATLNADYKKELIGERSFLTTPRHYAYLKISEGCNRTCAFCAIPLMRGKHISKSIEDCVKEAKDLARNGTKEIMLIAQELTYYGLDLYKERALPRLLEALAEVEGIEWIRLHYAYPSKFPLEIIEVMKAQSAVCDYLDIPLQHAATSVLERMRRQITRAETESLITNIRAIHPSIALRTTMLVGFPGETEEDFEELCDFIREQQFERLGVFTYSHEEGTSGYDLVDDVPQEVKEERASRLMEIQEEISLTKNLDKIGKQFKVLVDRKDGEVFIGRTAYDSPEVDNEVVIVADYLRVGDFVEVEITEASAFDLVAKPVNSQVPG